MVRNILRNVRGVTFIDLTLFQKSGNPLKVFCDMTTDGGKLRMANTKNSYTF